MAKTPKTQQQFTEIGRSGLKAWGGVLSEEFLADLRGSKGRAIYREMRDNDPIIGAMLFAIEYLLRSVPITVQPASADMADQEMAAFVGECLNDTATTWQDTLSEILTMLPFGWSALELVYKRRDDGKIGWGKWAPRAQESLDRWEMESTGDVMALVQRPAPTYESITLPADKMLFFRTQSHKNSPEGRSVLRNAYRPYYFLKRIQTIEGIGIERDLAGLPIMYAPPDVVNANATGANAATRDALKELVTNIRRDEQEGVLIPNAYDANGNRQYELVLLSTGGARQFDTNKIIERYQREIAVTVLADFILMGQREVGSYAMITDKSQLFALAITGWLDAVLAVVNREAIPRLLKLNGMMPERYPTATHPPVRTPSLAELGDFVTKLSGAGMLLFPDAALEAHMRAVAQFPPADAAQEVE